MPPEQVVLPASKGELIVVLRALASRRPKTREEMKQLQDDSLALALHIQRRMSLHDVPEPIWHFLSDQIGRAHV